MRYLLYTNDRTPNENHSPELTAALGKLMEDATRAGVLVDTGGFAGTVTRLRSSGGKVAVLDGPYTEAKELTGGYAVVDVPTEDDAVYWAKRFREVVGDGESIVQRMYRAAEGLPPQ